MALNIKDVTKSFGGLRALDGVSLAMREGEVTAIVGPNGAGKSTLFNIIGGHLRPDKGRVWMSGVNSSTLEVDLTDMPPYRIASEGVGMLFQSVRVFHRLSVLDNVLTGFMNQSGERLVSALIANGVPSEEKLRREEAIALLDFVGLNGKNDQPAGTLSFGDQKLLAIARLLAAKAKAILLDEPTSGVHPAMVEQLLSVISRLAHKEQRVVAIIEHNARIVRRVADAILTLEEGRVVSATGNGSAWQYSESEATENIHDEHVSS